MGKPSKGNASRKKEDTKKSIKVLLTLGIVVALLAIFFLASSAITKFTGYSVASEDEKTNIETCLEQHDIVLYINTKDTIKTLTAIGLVHLDKVEIMNCLENKEFCSEKGVDSFPTWIIDNKKIDERLDEGLLKIMGCQDKY